VQDTCLNGIQDKLVKSAHDCSEGGLAVALSECCFTGGVHRIGAKIDIPLEIRKDALLFGESQSRIVVTVAEGNINDFNKIAAGYMAPVVVIGRVGGQRLSINNLIDIPVQDMEKAWREAIPRRLTT